MPTQIHIYTINRGSLDEFASEWRDKIKPLREKFGFLTRATADDWESQNQAFYHSDERRSLQPDPARHIGRVEQYFVEVV